MDSDFKLEEVRIMESKDDMSLRFSNLPVRTRNLLYEVGIVTFQDVMSTSPYMLVSIYGISVRRFFRIVKELKAFGYDYCTKHQIKFNDKGTEFAYLSWSE